MLKKTLLVDKNINIGMFYEVEEYLKQKSKGYEGKESNILTGEQVLKFIQKASNPAFLMAKVSLLFDVFGRCRRQELVIISVEHIEDRISVIVVNVFETKTTRFRNERVFTIIVAN